MVETQEAALIIEDDINFTDNFSPVWKKAIQDLPSNYGLLYFTDLIHNRGTIQACEFTENSTLHRVRNYYWGTFAYLISPHAASVLLETAFPLKTQIDTYMINVTTEKDLPVYRTNTFIVKTDNSNNRTSDVQNVQVSAVPLHPSILSTVHVFASDNVIPEDWKNTSSWGYNTSIWTLERASSTFPFFGNKIEFNDTYIEAKMMWLQLKITTTFGGLLLVDPWRWNSRIHMPIFLNRDITRMLRNAQGVLGVHKQSEGEYSIRLLGATTSDTILQNGTLEVQQVITQAQKNSTTKKGVFALLSEIMLKWYVYTPTKDAGIIFPIEVMALKKK